MKPRKGGWSKLGRASGSAVGKIARRTYVCAGCGVQHHTKPVQCIDCGRMDFNSFDSIGEANRWAALRLREAAGLISDLQRQVRFDLLAHRPDGLGAKVGQYIADFTYTEDGSRVIEDFKGAITDVSAWKLRHMAAQGLPVKISTAKG
jgi:hypothetical protein